MAPPPSRGHIFCVWTVALIGALWSGCNLGPMPATTGVSSVPIQRIGGEAQFGWVPGYYLSSAVKKDPKGASVQQLALTFEPDDLAIPGLFFGGRIVGEEDTGTYPEAMLGYRALLDEQQAFALGVVAFGTRAGGARDNASYSATRVGSEVGFDWNATGPSHWFELHLLAGFSLTGMDVDGKYCLDVDGKYAVQCPEAGPSTFVDANAAGFYLAGTSGATLDFARHMESAFHGGRLALLVGLGTMPTVVAGRQESAIVYGSAGVTLTLGLGSAEKP